MNSQIVNSYIVKKDMSNYIDNLWQRASGKLKIKGIKPSDVDKAIQEVRSLGKSEV